MQFRILGPLEIADGTTVRTVARARPRALLATLCLSPGEAVSAERLIDALWGDEPPETAANALQVHVSHLRKVLGDDVIVRRGAGYVLAVAPEDVDVARFEQLVARARGSEPADAERLLREALALWRGDPEADRARLEEVRLAATEARIEAGLALGRHAELVPELESLVDAHPLRERLRGQLMRALYGSARQAEALEVYRGAREAFAAELGIEPSPELRQLERAILAQDPALAAPAAHEPVDSLPSPSTPLVGRTRQLHDAVSAVADEGVRLLTFTGPGGIGKTRLALEVAHALGGRFRDGAAFVPLAPISDTQLVGATIAQALGVTPTTEDALLEHVRERSLLLLLDNFEQVVDAAPLLARLLESAPRLVLLVTSQALLRVSGERELPVPPLDEAEELFRARATGLADDAGAAPAARELSVRPLRATVLSVLAAARTRILSPTALLSRLTSRLALLTAGARDAPERQRTMRAAIDWSYGLLEPDEQLLFARLGVFVGGASLAAIEAVCGEPATLDTLQALVENSLLRRREGDEPRFAMLETLREYAVEQLDASGDADATRRRHMQWCAALLDEAWEPSAGPEQARWFERLGTDHANLRAAISFAFESGDVETAYALAAGLRRFWYVRGHAEEGLRTYDALLERAAEASPLAHNQVLNGAAMLASARGDYGAARRYLEESLALAEQLGDAHRLGVALSNLGNVALYEDRFDEARALYERALALAGGGYRDASVALGNLGIATAYAGDLEGGIAYGEQAVASAQERQEPRGVATASVDLAWLLIERGDLERARSLLDAARATFDELADRAKQADALEALAGLAIAEGEEADALRLLDEAAAIRNEIGSVAHADQRRFVRRALERMRA